MQGQLNVELTGANAGTGYDQVLLSGETGEYNASLGGTLSLFWLSMSDCSEGTKLWILKNDTAGTLSGEFANYAQGAPLGKHNGIDWNIYYGADAASGRLTGGNDVVVAAVPEPAAIILLTIAVMGLLGCKWKRKSKVN